VTRLLAPRSASFVRGSSLRENSRCEAQTAATRGDESRPTFTGTFVFVFVFVFVFFFFFLARPLVFHAPPVDALFLHSTASSATERYRYGTSTVLRTTGTYYRYVRSRFACGPTTLQQSRSGRVSSKLMIERRRHDYYSVPLIPSGFAFYVSTAR